MTPASHGFTFHSSPGALLKCLHAMGGNIGITKMKTMTYRLIDDSPASPILEKEKTLTHGRESKQEH
jgi:hypothetical protein